MDANVALFLLLLVALAIGLWWLLMLVDALRVPQHVWKAAGQSQLIYVLLMVVVGVLGTIVYVAIARPQLRDAGAPNLR
ncbi:hypothetical protein [Aeromicrobium massiliense]|uniref:hypothetical protein n=1 Tax=Aeromicrobium massiliense TaxID=1464554 RepID=UPI000315A723|nr:hypothetical protein [Aeromicrobium massiliense]